MKLAYYRFLLLLGITLGCSENRTSSGLKLVQPTNSFEDSGEAITICWKNYDKAGKERIRYLERAVILQFNYRTNVGFNFKATCENKGSRYIEILFVDPSEIEELCRSKRADGCSTLGYHEGRSKIKISLAQDDKDFEAERNLRFSEISVLIHEVMHSLGFPHEHERIDADKDRFCDSQFPDMKGNVIKSGFLTPFDKHSVLNYCNYSDAALSELDIQGINKIYSKEMQGVDRNLQIPDHFQRYCNENRIDLIKNPVTLNLVHYYETDSCKDLYVKINTSPHISLELPSHNGLLQLVAEHRVINALILAGGVLDQSLADLSTLTHLELFELETFGKFVAERLPSPVNLRTLSIRASDPGKGFTTWIARAGNLTNSRFVLKNPHLPSPFPGGRSVRELSLSSSNSKIELDVSKLRKVERLSITGEQEHTLQAYTIIQRGREPTLHLVGLSNMKRLSSLSLYQVDVRLEKGFSELKMLESVDITFSKVTNSQYLYEAKAIETLNFMGSDVSTLVGISGLKNLSSLELFGSPVAGLSPLRPLSRIYRLSLTLPQVRETSGVRVENLSVHITQEFDLFQYADLFSKAKTIEFGGQMEFIHLEQLSVISEKKCKRSEYSITCD